MKIAVLSGKGGTGKTLVSVNLAAVLKKAIYLDCDVEEPNGHLFFKPTEIERQAVGVRIPIVDDQKCNGCRICTDVCRFNALAYIGNRVKVFEEVCHSCGGCSLFCPQGAIREKIKTIGVIESGMSQEVKVLSGILNIGEVTGVPIIKELLSITNQEKQTMIIDCPPGSACIVMESIKDADYCILVAEPTQFGVHNLAMVHELVTLFKKPVGVVLNKCIEIENPSENYCLQHQIPIIGKIAFDQELGQMNATGFIAVRENDKYHALFQGILAAVYKEVVV